MINKKDLELKLLLRESHIQQLNLKVDKLQQRIDDALKIIYGDFGRNMERNIKELLIECLKGVDKE